MMSNHTNLPLPSPTPTKNGSPTVAPITLHPIIARSDVPILANKTNFDPDPTINIVITSQATLAMVKDEPVLITQIQ